MPLSVANFARSMKPPLFREDPTVFESSQYLIFSRIMKQIITLLDHYVEKVHPPTRLGKKKRKGNRATRAAMADGGWTDGGTDGIGGAISRLIESASFVSFCCPSHLMDANACRAEGRRFCAASARRRRRQRRRRRRRQRRRRRRLSLSKLLVYWWAPAAAIHQSRTVAAPCAFGRLFMCFFSLIFISPPLLSIYGCVCVCLCSFRELPMNQLKTKPSTPLSMATIGFGFKIKNFVKDQKFFPTS